MKKFTSITSIAAPFLDVNIDTDIIIPKQFLKTVKRTGLGIYAFNDRRYLNDGSPNPDFPLNAPEFKGAQILLAGDNFGCGSSREHAVWAITDMGFNVIIAPSFADIFRTNATKNGLLLITLTKPQCDALAEISHQDAASQFTVDLSSQTISSPKLKDGDISFDVDPFVKYCFINGLDEIGLTLQQQDSISAYESRQKQDWPWV